MSLSLLRCHLAASIARFRSDESGAIDSGFLTTLLVCLAIVALVVYLVTTYTVTKK